MVSARACFSSRRASTLIELLVVVAIVGILVAMLLVAVQQARAAAARVLCANNLKQIGIALHCFHDANGHLPPGSVSQPGAIDEYWGVWSVYALPFLEQESLGNGYDFNKLNWDTSTPGQGAVRQAAVKVFSCPADPTYEQLLHPESGDGAGQLYRTGNYRANVGRGQSANTYFDFNSDATGLPMAWRGPMHATGFGGLTTERVQDILDGTSNTLLVVERSTKTHPQRHTFWAYAHASYWSSSAVPQSRILLNDYDACVAVNPADDGPCKRGMSSFHNAGANGFNALLCDGSVRFITAHIDLNILCALSTIAGGETMSAY
jgi:hypothetical protein